MLNVANSNVELRKAHVKMCRERSAYLKLENIDTMIQQLSERLQEASEQEEGLIVDKIHNLNYSKEQMKVLLEKVGALTQSSDVHASIKTRMKECEQQLSKLGEEETQLRREVESMQDAVQDEVADIPSLHDEKSALYAQIQEMRKEVEEAREAHQKRWDRYKKDMDEFMEAQKELRKQRDEDRRNEAERLLEEEDEAMGYAPSKPYDDQLYTCDELLAYLAILSKPKAVQASSSQEGREEVSMQGMAVVRKSTGEIDDVFDAVQKGKKNKKSKKAKTGAAGDVEGERKLTHSMEVLSAFAQMKVQWPSVLSEVGAAQEQVEARKSRFLDLQKQALEAQARGEKWVPPKEEGEEEDKPKQSLAKPA